MGPEYKGFQIAEAEKNWLRRSAVKNLLFKGSQIKLSFFDAVLLSIW